MSKKKVRGVLDELIREPGKRMKEPDLKQIVTLGIPVRHGEGNVTEVVLDEIDIFRGIDAVITKLLDQVRESCFFGQTDVFTSVNVQREECPELYNHGIHKVFFYSAFENLEQLGELYPKMNLHLRYIFNMMQSPAINRGLFRQSGSGKEPEALLFPFNRDASDDTSGLHYLVERVPGSHFLRITAEELSHSRLNFRRIHHRLISTIDLGAKPYSFASDAAIMFSSLLSHCRDNKLSSRETGLQLGDLISYLKSAGYDELKEILMNWPRKLAGELLMHPGDSWRGLIDRLLLIIHDTTTSRLLNSQKVVKVLYRDAQAYVSLNQRGRSLQIDLGERVLTAALDHYLGTMGHLKNYVDNSEVQLKDVHLLFIHHLTNESLALLGAFDQLAAARVDTLWVKYTGSIPSSFMNSMMALPDSVYRFYAMQPINAGLMGNSYCLSDNYSPLNGFEGLQKYLVENKIGFFEAMQYMAMHLFLDAAAIAERGKKVVIAEDGGYLAPVVNQLAINRLTVGEVCQRYIYPADRIPERDIGMVFADWINDVYPGSVEHTRNGYDALKDVENIHGRLAFPACTLAISKYKVLDESIEVAYSCINAIENILNGQGFVLNTRRCLVLGSLGAIGIQTIYALLPRLGKEKLAGVDVEEQETRPHPCLQVSSISSLPGEVLYETDLFFGVVGKSILDASFFEDLVILTRCCNIFLVSGSTKRAEFLDFIHWVEKLLKEEQPTIAGYQSRLDTYPIEDPQTRTLLGSRIRFNIEMPAKTKTLDIYLLSHGMPVNFQYYGVPRETMDVVMSEFLAMVNIVCNSQKGDLPAKVLALDHQIDRSSVVYKRFFP